MFYEDTTVLMWWPNGHSATHYNCNRLIRSARDETYFPSRILSCLEGHYPSVLAILGMSPVESLY